MLDFKVTNANLSRHGTAKADKKTPRNPALLERFVKVDFH